MALNSFSEQTYTRVPVKREPKKTGRRYGSAGLTYPIDMGIDAPAELDNHIIFDIYFDETTSFTNIQGTRDEPKAWKGHSAIVGNKATKAIENLEQGVKNLAGVGEGGLADKALNAIPEGVTSSVGKFKNGAFGGAQNLKKLNVSIALAVTNTFTAT